MKPNVRMVSSLLCGMPALLAVTLAGGCSTEPPSPATISVSPSSATMDALEELQLTAAVLDEHGQVMTDIAVTWSVESESVATITDNGLVTSVSLDAAKTRVYATVGTVEGFIPVTIKPGPRAWLTKAHDALGGPRWSDSDNWGTTAQLDDWHGVTADAQGNVTGLHLDENELSGTIPSELGNLTSLVGLDLKDNSVVGSIPPELGGLPNLKSLILDRNHLTGPIPPDLGNLENLWYLSLNGNNLTGPIPPELGSLPYLSHLDLAANRLTGPIPPDLGNLDDLWYLLLDWNDLTGPIPPELGNLQKLASLELRRNRLTGAIPPELGSLRNLGSLDLADNELTGPIPRRFGDLHKLSVLDVHNNTLSGRLPRELIGMPLKVFFWNLTDLCAPTDAAFREWLASIPTYRPAGDCTSE